MDQFPVRHWFRGWEFPLEIYRDDNCARWSLRKPEQPGCVSRVATPPGGVLQGYAGSRKGWPVSMLRIPSPCRIKPTLLAAHRIPRSKRGVTNRAVYNEALRQRGSLTVWFSDGAIAAWKAAPRTTLNGLRSGLLHFSAGRAVREPPSGQSSWADRESRAFRKIGGTGPRTGVTPWNEQILRKNRKAHRPPPLSVTSRTRPAAVGTGSTTVLGSSGAD